MKIDDDSIFQEGLYVPRQGWSGQCNTRTGRVRQLREVVRGLQEHEYESEDVTLSVLRDEKVSHACLECSELSVGDGHASGKAASGSSLATLLGSRLVYERCLKYRSSPGRAVTH